MFEENKPLPRAEGQASNDNTLDVRFGVGGAVPNALYGLITSSRQPIHRIVFASDLENDRAVAFAAQLALRQVMERPTHSHCGKRTDDQADYEQRNGIEGQPHSTLTPLPGREGGLRLAYKFLIIRKLGAGSSKKACASRAP